MAAIILLLASAGLVWGLVYAKYGSLLTGAVAFIAFGYLLNHHFWTAALGPVSFTVGRLILVGLILLLIWRWGQGKIERRPLTGYDWLAGLFLGYVTLRFAFTTSGPLGVTSDVSPFWRLIASFWMPAALYLVVRNAELTEKNWKKLLACLSILGVYLAITGIAEATQQWWAVFPRFIADPTLGLHFGRARGPALMSASLGVFLTICFWASWFLWARVERCWQLVLLAAMILMCVAVYFTYTRSTWLGLAGGLVVIPLLHLPRQWRPILVTCLLVLGAAGALIVGDKLINLHRGDSASAGRSAYQRASFFYVSMKMAADQPLLGCGFGRFYDCKLPYLSDRHQQLELESLRELDHHNALLSILTETGLVGFVLFAGLLFSWTRAAWQLIRDKTAEDWIRAHGLFTLAGLITYSASALFHDLTLSPSEQWILCLLTGMTVGLRSRMLAPADQRKYVQLRRSSHVVRRDELRTVEPQSVNLFGMKIDAVDISEATGIISVWCRQSASSRCRFVVTPNVDHTVKFQSNAALQTAYHEASLVLADGAPVVLAARILGKAIPERVAGSDLVPALFEEASRTESSKPLRVFLLGAAPGVAERAAQEIHRRWSGVEVVGTYAPPHNFEHSATENEQILRRIADCQPDLLLVGLGAPKQEIWVQRHVDRLQAKTALCVGATIDFLAGEKNRAPLWMRDAGLEWLYRLANEPSRLAQRYLNDAWVFPQLLWRELRKA